MELRVLAVGDVVGVSGLKHLEKHLRSVKRLYGVDFCVVNGENASVVGLTPQQADAMLDAGADVITLGNHTWNRREICPYLDDSPYILRPANFQPSLPGRGWGVFETKAGPVAVANLIGRCSMDFSPDNPFRVVDKTQGRGGSSDFHRLPRRGHERKARDGLLFRRQNFRPLGHTYARSHGGRADPPARHGLSDRHRHDGAGCVGAWREAGAVRSSRCSAESSQAATRRPLVRANSAARSSRSTRRRGFAPRSSA